MTDIVMDQVFDSIVSRLDREFQKDYPSCKNLTVLKGKMGLSVFREAFNDLDSPMEDVIARIRQHRETLAKISVKGEDSRHLFLYVQTLTNNLAHLLGISAAPEAMAYARKTAGDRYMHEYGESRHYAGVVVDQRAQKPVKEFSEVYRLHHADAARHWYEVFEQTFETEEGVKHNQDLTLGRELEQKVRSPEATATDCEAYAQWMIDYLKEKHPSRIFTARAYEIGMHSIERAGSLGLPDAKKENLKSTIGAAIVEARNHQDQLRAQAATEQPPSGEIAYPHIEALQKRYKDLQLPKSILSVSAEGGAQEPSLENMKSLFSGTGLHAIYPECMARLDVLFQQGTGNSAAERVNAIKEIDSIEGDITKETEVALVLSRLNPFASNAENYPYMAGRNLARFFLYGAKAQLLAENFQENHTMPVAFEWIKTKRKMIADLGYVFQSDQELNQACDGLLAPYMKAYDDLNKAITACEKADKKVNGQSLLVAAQECAKAYQDCTLPFAREAIARQAQVMFNRSITEGAHAAAVQPYIDFVLEDGAEHNPVNYRHLIEALEDMKDRVSGRKPDLQEGTKACLVTAALEVRVRSGQADSIEAYVQNLAEKAEYKGPKGSVLLAKKCADVAAHIKGISGFAVRQELRRRAEDIFENLIQNDAYSHAVAPYVDSLKNNPIYEGHSGILAIAEKLHRMAYAVAGQDEDAQADTQDQLIKRAISLAGDVVKNDPTHQKANLTLGLVLSSTDDQATAARHFHVAMSGSDESIKKEAQGKLFALCGREVFTTVLRADIAGEAVVFEAGPDGAITASTRPNPAVDSGLTGATPN